MSSATHTTCLPPSASSRALVTMVQSASALHWTNDIDAASHLPPRYRKKPCLFFLLERKVSRSVSKHVVSSMV